MRTFLLLVTIIFVADIALAQDRSRSRYVSDDSNDDEYRGDRVPNFATRQTSSRRRQPAPSPQEEDASAPADRGARTDHRVPGNRLPSRQVDPAYNLRQPVSNTARYQQPAEPIFPPSEAEVPDNASQRRRKRPKKRRRPKTEAKQEADATPSSVADHEPKPIAETGDEYFAYRKPQPSAAVDRNVPPRGRPHVDSAPLIDTRRHRQPLPADDAQRLPDSRSPRRQTHQPATVNRLPIPDDSRKPANKPTYSESPARAPQPPSAPSRGSEDFGDDHSISGGYHTNYATAEDNEASRLPVPAGHEATGLLDQRRHSAARLPDPVFGQHGSEYDKQPERPESPLPVSPADIGGTSDQQHGARYSPSTNRLPDPVLPYHPNAAPLPLDPADDGNFGVPAGEPTRQPVPASLTSDRLPSDDYIRSLPYQQSSGQDRLPPSPESRSNVGSRVESRAPAEATRSGSRYPAAEREATRGTQARRPSTPFSRPESPPQRTSYRGGNRESSEPPTTTSAPRTGARLQRTGSRYQAEDPELTRSSHPRSSQRGNRVPDSVPARTVSSAQNTRSRYQEDPNLNAGQTHRPEPTRPSRSSSRYRGDTAALKTSHFPNLSEVSHRVLEEQSTRQRSPQVRDRTRSHAQPQRQEPAAPPASEEPPTNDDLFYRSRPQFQPDAASPTTSEYIPQYQSVQRTPQRRPETRQPAPQADASSRQRRPPSRQPHGEPAARPASEAAPRSTSQFRCPEPYGFYQDDHQCDKYYECRNGTATEGLCSDGLAFNPISAPTYLRCDSIRDIDCSSRPELQPPQPTKNCPRRFGLFPDEKECTKFWHCVDGTATQVQCPPGLVYDDTKGTCNWADLVENSCSTEDLLGFKCPEASPTELQEGVYVRYAHPDNCQLHFTCLTGADGQRRPRMLSCNEGFVFDPQTSQCTRPENVPGCEEFYGKPPARSTSRRQKQRDPLPEDEEVYEEEEEPQHRSQRRRRPNQRTRS